MEAEALLQRKQMGEFLDRHLESSIEARFDMKYLRAIWEFCSYIFVPQWGRNKRIEA